MAAHDSQYPGEAKPKSIRIDPSGISMNWKNTAAFISSVLAVLAGTGGYASFRLVTEQQVDQKVATSEARTIAKIDVVKKDVKKVRDEIGGPAGLKATIGDVQHVQHSDIAIREARRVVEEQVQCRRNDDGCAERRAQEQERIRRLNMKRLKAKLDPCASLVCN